MKRTFRGKQGLWMMALLAMGWLAASQVQAQKNMEYLDRGLVAVTRSGDVFLSWRIFATDTGQVEFNIYRNDTLVNQSPVTGKSNFIDTLGTTSDVYHLEVTDNGADPVVSAPVTVWKSPYLTVPLQTPSGYTPNDASVADLDGDGELDLVVKMEGATRDNSQSGITDPVYLHAYKLNGTFLWSINLGINIRGGAHYTQFMVYDLDSDGRAEVACKTAPGTRDGTGAYLSDGPAASDDDQADYRNGSGYILDGPEYLTVFDGLTGEERSTVNYIPHRSDPYPLSTWGDTYGNRVDRFLACVAYYDSIPSLVMCRGYYDRTALTAWDFTEGQLVQRWAFDTQTDQENLRQYEEQGNHNLAVGDVDGDGRDEIMYGGMAFDDDGTPLYNTDFRHGDAGHLSDLIPGRPGLEYFTAHENAGRTNRNGVTIPGFSVRDAATGEILIGPEADGDIGRGLAADISSAHPGYEYWASSGLGVYNSSGTKFSSNIPSINFAAWWDGDLLRELLDGTVISKWNQGSLLTAIGCLSNNGTKSTPALSGDILGDWREEVIWRTNDNQSLRIYTTTIPTQYGLYTLLQDPQYRQALTWQNVAYNQPPHPGFFLGHGMEDPPMPDIRVLPRNTDPVLIISSPINGEELNLGLDMNVILTTAGISDTNQMVVIFDNDTTVLDTIPAPPYAASISGLSSGEHVITAGAYDIEGNWFTSLPVTVTVDEGYPHVEITSPATGAIFGPGESFTVEADAYDTDGSIDSVEFYVNDALFSTDTESPYMAEISDPAVGLYKILAVAWDDTQKFTESDSIRVEVGSVVILQEDEQGFCGFGNGSGTIDSNHPGHTGSGFANSENTLGVRLYYAVDLPADGDYTFTFRYAATNARPGDLYVGPDVMGTVDFQSTGDWVIWEEASLTVTGLSAGLARITLEAAGNDGLPNIDYMKVVSLSTEENPAAGDCSSLPPITGVKEARHMQDNSFSLYPVPASELMNVRLEDPAGRIGRVTISSLDGRLVLEADGEEAQEMQLDVGSLDNGIYVIRLDSGTGSHTRIFNVIK